MHTTYDDHDSLTVTDDAGMWRATVTPADYADAPDGDGYGYVLRRTWSDAYGYTWTVVHADGDGFHAASQLADRLATAWSHDGLTRGDDDAVERALTRASVDWHDFRSHVDRSGDDYVIVVTADHMRAWGRDPDDDDADQVAHGAAYDWRAWLDGEVYDVTITRRVVPDRCDVRAAWFTGVAVCMSCAADCDCYGCTHETDRWELVTSIGGLYGAEWAEEAAREELANYAD